MADPSFIGFDERLLDRIRGEFLESPGLGLTTPEAARLMGLDLTACERVLEDLVESGFLERGAHGRYHRMPDE